MKKTHNPYFLKAKVAAKALEEKIERERQAELTDMTQSYYCNPEPYTPEELRAIASDTSRSNPDAEDTLKYISLWKAECIEIEQITEKVNSLNLKLGKQFLLSNLPEYRWTIYQEKDKDMGEAMATLIKFNSGWKIVKYSVTYSVTSEEKRSLRELIDFVS